MKRFEKDDGHADVRSAIDDPGARCPRREGVRAVDEDFVDEEQRRAVIGILDAGAEQTHHAAAGVAPVTRGVPGDARIVAGERKTEPSEPLREEGVAEHPAGARRREGHATVYRSPAVNR
jgi:hypothetical protein